MHVVPGAAGDPVALSVASVDAVVAGAARRLATGTKPGAGL